MAGSPCACSCRSGATTILTVEPGDVLGWSARAALPRHLDRRRRGTDPPLEFDVETLRRALREDRPWATVYPRVLEAARRLGATRHQLLDLYAQEAERVPW